ncbi:MAG: hypothetical protein QXM31_00835 [Candidatus Woesearchaeota archaeon]
MAEEGRGVALAILGIVAVIAVVGLVLLFTGATGKVSEGGIGYPKIYTRQSEIGVASGRADVENPYYGYEYETYGGVTQSREATSQYIAAGGAWDPTKVYGDATWEAATEPGVGAAPNIMETTQAPTWKRAPSHIPSGQSDVCGNCPYGSQCIASSNAVPTGARAVAGYPGCYVLGSTY